MKKILKQPLGLFVICMAVVLVFSLFANMVNTSMYSVSVKKVNFNTETNNGNIEGLLYRPRECNADNPCPVIVTTHGYLNSKEMQDAPSIELSKRGYIVLAIDMYDHGGSTWDTPEEFEFYYTSLWDAVKWVYNKPYTLKDSVGNGMIAVSGHSMGGFSSELAVKYDTEAMAIQGHRKIAVTLSVGADYRWSGPDIIDLFGSRSSGMIIAHFDEFFGNSEWVNTVTYKDYIKTDEGKAFLGNETNLGEDSEYKEGKFYEYAGGQRVIYTPYETHPMNHFSAVTTSYMIDFYDQAFAYQLEVAGLTAEFSPDKALGQTWWLKEAFECVALVALLISVVPALILLMKVPFFAKVRTEEENLTDKEKLEDNVSETKIEQEAVETINESVEEAVVTDNKDDITVKQTPNAKRIGLVLIAIITSLIPAYFFPSFINRSGELSSFTRLADYIIRICIALIVGVWLVYLGVKMIKGKDSEEKARDVAIDVTKGSIIVSAFSLFLRFMTTTAVDSLNLNAYYNTPTANDIAYWALISAAISLLVIAIVHFTIRKREGATIKDYGLKANIKQILIALLISVIIFTGLYLVVFLIGLIFNTDFRLWVYAIKSFKLHHFAAFLRYVPLYFIFYFVNSIVVMINTKDVKGFKGYLYAMFLNAGGLILFLVVQYGKLFLTGEAAVTNLALPAILLFGLIPSLIVAAIFARKFYEKTNNIWTSAFFNTLLFTMIAIANTAVYLLSM